MEPTSRALRGRGAICLSGVETYLPGTVGRGGGCLSGVEITSWTFWGRGAGRLSGVGTYLPGTVRQGYRLFKGCQSLPPGHCGAGVQAV